MATRRTRDDEDGTPTVPSVATAATPDTNAPIDESMPMDDVDLGAFDDGDDDLVVDNHVDVAASSSIGAPSSESIDSNNGRLYQRSHRTQSGRARGGRGRGGRYHSSSCATASDDAKSGRAVHNIVANFVKDLQSALHKRQYFEADEYRDTKFAHISERYFKTRPWPSADQLADLVEKDQSFLVLYNELVYRHMFGVVYPSLKDRIDSFLNYSELFSLINDESDLADSLPSSWFYDIIDEFVWQFQSFCRHRLSKQRLNEADHHALQEHPEAWTASSVMTILSDLVKKSESTKQLVSKDSLSTRQLYGKYALVGLLRVHCHHGDFEAAIHALDSVDLAQWNELFELFQCHVTTSYYIGVAYFMLHRYNDAVRVFAEVLTYARARKTSTKGCQFEAAMKMIEKIYNFFAMIVALCPQRIDEFILNDLKSKIADKYGHLQRMELKAFEEVFLSSAPKFIHVNIDNTISDPAISPQDPMQQQLKAFMVEVNHRKILNDISSYVGLYSQMAINQLASFLELDIDILQSHLQEVQQNKSQFVGFRIENDMLVTIENASKESSQNGAHWLKEINRLRDIQQIVSQY